MRLLSPITDRLNRIWRRDIWMSPTSQDKNPRDRLYLFLRVISITLSGLRDLKVAARASALSYSSLLALGPLIALVVLVSGFALGNRDPALLAQNLGRVVSFIAPQVAQFDRTDNSGEAPAVATAAAPDPELVRLINNFIIHSRSGAAGVIGVFTLLLIVIQLFSTVEDTFNDIWGVRRGRSWLMRVVYYWSAITLGAVLFFASLTLFSAGLLLSMLDHLPFAQHLRQLFTWVLPFASVAFVVVVLTVFYRVVPHTRVHWMAALLGALMVTTLLFLNNYLAFLYFRHVMLSRSLYGSVGILPILMLGLYVFWFFVLVGGQFTYAVQNVQYRSSQTVWHSLNEYTRESLSLLILLLIARRFQASSPAQSVSELALRIRMPSQILNESLNRLCDLGLIAELPSEPGADPNDHRYQPARPLASITLATFKREFARYGDDPGGTALEKADPVLSGYHQLLSASLQGSLGTKSLEDLIREYPESLPAPDPAPTPA